MIYLCLQLKLLIITIVSYSTCSTVRLVRTPLRGITSSVEHLYRDTHNGTNVLHDTISNQPRKVHII